MGSFIAIDLKSFYASVECVERGLDPLTTNLVVADSSRTEKTICLAVSPSLKAYGISGRARLFEVVQRVKEVNKEKAFYLFHELRHSLQYLCPGMFSSMVSRSIQYVIMYDGTCYKIIDGKYCECKLDGGEEVFSDIYLGQPYEVDANKYAYEQARNIYGDSEGLRRLYEFWIPSQPLPDEVYDSIYTLIDEKTKEKE